MLIISGDVKRNPGPKGFPEVQVNTRGWERNWTFLRKKVNKLVPLRLADFHSPVRQDRSDDPYGGVAIYVRNKLYCKPRAILHVNNLEGVRVKTKLNQEIFLVGSF